MVTASISSAIQTNAKKPVNRLNPAVAQGKKLATQNPSIIGTAANDKSPIRHLSGTGIFLKTQMGGSTSKDLVGVIKNIHPDKFDLSNSGQFRVGENLPVTSEHWAGF